MRESLVVMVGPSLKARGGIAAVVNVYRQAGLFACWNVRYISSFAGTNAIAKAGAAFSGLFKYLCILLGGKLSILHVHSASRWSFIRKSLFILPALALRKPVIFQLHGGEFLSFYGRRNALGKAYIRFVLQSCACVVVLSDRWKRGLQEIAPRAAIRVIMNPILTQAIDPFASRRAGTFLFLGRLERQKGVFVLLEALSRIGAGHRVRLLLGGEGDAVHLQSEIQRRGVSESVELLGWVDGARKTQLLQTAAALVLPSFAEGLPVSMLEAMAHGTAVIATPVGGIPDVLEDGVEGILVPPGDAGKLADAMRHVIENPEAARKMGENGRRKFEDQFSVEIIMPQVEALYADMGVKGGDSPVESRDARE